MKKTLVALSLAAMTLPALAQDKKAPEPDYTITGNFGLFSDYRFRGMSQTDKKPAAQGGFDYAHKSGFYLGTWTSNVTTWANAGGNGQELDIYGGFKGSLPMNVNFDIGYLAYVYPGNTATISQGTKEVYVGVSYGPLTYKVSRTTGNWFGFCANSSGSLYHDLSASIPISDKVSLGAHAGLQDIKCATDYDFQDYKLGITYDLGGSFSLGVAYVSTSGLSAAGKQSFTNGTKKLYESGGVISLTKTF